MQVERECFRFKYKTSCDRITAGLPTAEITGYFVDTVGEYAKKIGEYVKTQQRKDPIVDKVNNQSLLTRYYISLRCSFVLKIFL